MKLGAPDLWTGLALMVLAGLYCASAGSISDSLLTDAVGADGLPKLLAVALGFCGAMLAVRSQAAMAPTVKLAIRAQAAGLVLVLAAYIAALPVIGYAVAIGILIASVALLAGARSIPALLVTAIVAGAGFQLVFVRLFHIAMPGGLFTRWI